MNNFDDIFVDQKTGETANNKDFVPFNKDEWAARKQQERADAYALIDRAAEDAAKDGGVFQGYLDVQSRFDRYSVGNALLITIQMPEATRLADYNGWKDNNVYVKKGATGITILEPGDEYTREDGSVGVWYNAKKVFDISQTNSRQQAAPAVSHDPRLLLKALINNAPCKISISENLPENVYAAYQPQDKVILIRQGMDAPDIFRALSQELAHAHMDRGEYNRADCAFTAYCVSYMLCKRNSIAVDIDFVRSFRAKILNQTDPLAMLRKQSAQPRFSTTPQPKRQSQPIYTTPAKKPVGCFGIVAAFLIVVACIIAFLL